MELKIEEEIINGIKHIVKHYNENNIKIKMTYLNDQIHREDDLPAVINYSHNIHTWYKNGKIHRDGDKPANVLFYKNEKEWYKDGKLHRGNGKPAVVFENEKNINQYWINDEQVNYKEAIKYSMIGKLKEFS